jgi:hypothetical protein
MHKISVINIAPVMKSLAHGQHVKNMFVSHETVSYNIVGLADITGLEKVLKEEGYGIQGMTDMDGHKCWARGMGESVLWHAGSVNGVAVGVENISEIPLLLEHKKINHEQAHTMWLHREKQLTALAILMAAWHNSDTKNHPLVRSTGKIGSPGVCSHWDVSQHYADSEGHWDCWPYDKGGYFPLAHVLELAKVYAAQGYCF